MTIIDRYIIKEFLKYFFIILIMVASLQILIDFIGDIDRFLSDDIGLGQGLYYVLLRSPKIMVLLIPVATTLSLIAAYGIMNRNHEIIALKSSGANLFFLMKPALIIGFVASLIFFAASEIVVPKTKAIANHLELTDFGKRNIVSTSEKNIWLKGDNLICNVRYYDPAQKSIFGVSLYYFGTDFKMVRRLDAESGSLVDDSWMLYGVMEQVLDPLGGDFQVSLHEKIPVNIDITGEDLKRVTRLSEEMGIWELSKYISKVESEGYNAKVYRVDLHGKIALPMVCVILSIIAVCLAVRMDLKGKMAITIGIGMACAFSYWVVHSFCLSMGKGEVMGIIVSAWMANFIYSCLAAITVVNSD